jgi:hypothetical protein
MTAHSNLSRYKRSQVEHAIWRMLTSQNPGAGDPSPVFLTRIKRILEEDRAAKLITGLDTDVAPFAFADEASPGRGGDAAFTPFDAFCLALALDLVNAGYKPSEVIVLLRLFRPYLVEQFDEIRRTPRPDGRQRERPREGLPSFWDKSGEWADGRVYMVVRKVELKEVVPGRSGATNAPGYVEPTFCRGLEALSEELGRMGIGDGSYRQALVLELAYLAVRLNAFLEKAPLTHRGRS